MDLKEFLDAYREECAREDAEAHDPASYNLTPNRDDNWRFKAEMKWADELDQDREYPED